MAACAVMLPGELRCVGMKQVEVRVIIVQCLERDFILDKHYNTVALLLLLVGKASVHLLKQSAMTNM